MRNHLGIGYHRKKVMILRVAVYINDINKQAGRREYTGFFTGRSFPDLNSVFVATDKGQSQRQVRYRKALLQTAPHERATSPKSWQKQE